jgi:hypothetical protein
MIARSLMRRDLPFPAAGCGKETRGNPGRPRSVGCFLQEIYSELSPPLAEIPDFFVFVAKINSDQ